VYGLSPAVITFRFDGDVIEDDACPEDVGLEDEDLIDAQVMRLAAACPILACSIPLNDLLIFTYFIGYQVDKTLFEAAVASANSRKNSNL
jgi:hypothetical protein